MTKDLSSRLKVFDEGGRELDATFSVTCTGKKGDLIFESRGGQRAATDARNVDYNPGLELILRRLQRLGASLEDIHVESKATLRMALPQRQVRIPEHPYPVVLERVEDIRALRVALGRAQAAVGQAPGARGGNSTKRIRVTFSLSRPCGELELRAMLSRGAPA